MQQTNRTILFEILNPEITNLITLISDHKAESLEDSNLQRINDNLQVSSFEECLDRFQPTLYLCINMEEKEVVCMDQLIDAHTGKFREINKIILDKNNALLSMFSKVLIEEESNQKSLYSQQELMESMLPKIDVQEFRKRRSTLIRAFTTGHEAEAKQVFQLMVKEYDNAMLLLRLYLEEACNLFENYDRGSFSYPILLSDKKENQMETVRISDLFYLQIPHMKPKDQDGYLLFVDRLFEAYPVINEELLRLIISIPFSNVLQEEQIISTYNEYLQFYKDVLDNYWGQCKRKLETLLGVFTFFNQYQTNHPMMPPRLLIANISVEDIKTAPGLNKLEVYLHSVNSKTYFDQTLWYAILPRTEFATRVTNPSSNQFIGKEVFCQTRGNQIDSIRNLASILAKYKIHSLISNCVDVKTGCNYLITNGVNDWVEYQKKLFDQEAAEYMYPCFPNFTLIPEAHSELVIGKRATQSEFGTIVLEERGSVTLWIKTLGVEASYVAAGLYAACQCPGYLQRFYKQKIDTSLPGVAYSMTQEGHSYHTGPFLQLDTIRFPERFVEDVLKLLAGVFFVSMRGKTYVALDQGMMYLRGEKNTLKDVQTLTYIERMMQAATQDYKSDLIPLFFNQSPGSLMDHWRNNAEAVNAILKKDETIRYDIDLEHKQCLLEVEFNEARKTRVLLITE